MRGLIALIGSQTNSASHLTADGLLQQDAGEPTLKQSSWCSPGFCRLSSCDLRDGREPVSSACGRVCLAFNGAIYNDRFVEYPSQAAAQALIGAYLQHGPSFVEQLDGDFAIVIGDSRSRTCYAFRDPAGVKPLYYTSWNGDRVWAVASEVSAFFEHREFTTGIDRTALAEGAVLNFWARDRTCFERIRQLPAGYCLTLHVPPECGVPIQEARVTEFAPYRPPVSESEGAARFERTVAKCAKLIRAAVRKRIEHTEGHPVVIASSGGIDSSIIAAAAAKEYADRIAAITIGDDPLLPAFSRASRLSREIGLRHTCHSIELQDFQSEFARLVRASPGPQPCYSGYFLGRAARHLHPEANVVLCGEGADELFLGDPAFLDIERVRTRMLRVLDAISLASLDSSPLLERIRSWERRNVNELWSEFVAMYQREQLTAPFDGALAAHSVECRVPFLDADLMAYLEKVPNELRIARGTPKIHLRGVLKRVLPAFQANPILDAPKEPAFFSTRRSQAWLDEFLNEKIGKGRLSKSDLRVFARNASDLFWLAGIHVVFLKHHGKIGGMTFADLADEVLYGTVS